ncbi:MAG: Txe/YoeB family addiction module toxin [Defluviitaleaceae bacterium]|nr:Txe/YoeB family addiction module toxin [Defluviitaleaceae bacterium]
MYSVAYSKQSLKDIPRLKSAKLDNQAKTLISVIQQNPYQTPPPYEKLRGKLKGAYSRRINRTHRLVYEIFEDERIVRVISMWTHYEQ